MNIDSVTTSSPPMRAPLPEMAKQSTKASAIQGKIAEAAKNQQPAVEQTRKEPSSSEIEKAVKQLNDFVAPRQSDLSFSIDEELGVQVVKILDNQSKEVLRQFPSEEALELARALDKLQGLLIKDKA